MKGCWQCRGLSRLLSVVTDENSSGRWRTGTVVIHRRFRRTVVISNAESAIYASGARMGGVASRGRLSL